MQSQIQDFNKRLVDEGIDITIIEYVKKINDTFYNIDISFIDDFIDLVSRDDFTIHHSMLQKYGVLQIKDSYNIKRVLDANDFQENIDYKTTSLNIEGRTDYILKPDVFKILLIRSKNTKKYAKYYLLLEKCIYYYNQYEKMKLQQLIQDNNKLKLLKLADSNTLDNFVIITDNRRKTFKHGVIRGTLKNVEETLIDLGLTSDNIVFKINVPSSQNFSKRIKEVLGIKFQREKVYYCKETGERFIEGEDQEPAFFEDRKWIVTVNRWFKLNDITFDDFIIMLEQIDCERYDK